MWGRKRFFGLFLSLLMLVPIFKPVEANAGPAREILLTSTYGVIAGSIVGLATLAFVGSPGDSLRNIAMGASIGLYVGIALGIYVAYGIDLGGEEGEEEKGDEGGGFNLFGGDDDEEKDEEKRDQNNPLPNEPPEGTPDLNQGFLFPPENGIEWQLPTLALAPEQNLITGQVQGWRVHSNFIRIKF
jgi:hypothetical protein